MLFSKFLSSYAVLFSDLKIYVIAAAVSSAVSTPASALASTAVILVGLAASTLTGTTTARRVLSSAAVLSPGGIVIVCHNLGEFLQLSIAPALCVSHNQVHALHASRRHLLLAHLATRSHTDGEQSEVGETNALAVQNQMLQAVEGIHQYTVDSTSAVWRIVLRDMSHEVLETHLTVAHGSSLPELLTCVLTCLRGTHNLTILTSSLSHNQSVFKGLIIQF